MFTQTGSSGFVDGSMVDPRREGGDGVKKVSYGVWEGVRPEAEIQTGYLTAEERLRLCTRAGMWGGGLPADWGSNEAEMFAVLQYLREMVHRSDDPSAERVLVLSDCQGVLSSIERAWRAGKAWACKNRDRGGMIEAICHLRAQLGTVVLAWCPGHRGVSGNEYADMIAKAHLDATPDETTRTIASMVYSRDAYAMPCTNARVSTMMDGS